VTFRQPPEEFRAFLETHIQPGSSSAAAIYERMRGGLFLLPAWESRPKVAVEIGGGTGWATRVLSKIPGVRFSVAVDVARTYLREVVVSGYALERVQATAEGRLPLKDDTADFVLSSEVFEHLWKREQFVAEVRRVLRPGGLFVMTTPNLDSFGLHFLRRLPRDWARRILTRESPHHAGLHPEFFPELLEGRGRVWHVIEGASLKDLRRIGDRAGLTTVDAGTWGLLLTPQFWDRLPRGLRSVGMSFFRFLPFGLRHVVVVFRKGPEAKGAARPIAPSG